MDDLEPTDEIVKDIKVALETGSRTLMQKRVIALFRKYGHSFACTVELGGKLQTTRIVDASSSVSTSAPI